MDKYNYQNAVDRAKKHSVISQYTDLCALKKIIGNKTLRFTRMDKVNDKIENDKIHELWKNKVYVSCFTYREYESYFFWNTYAKCKPCGIMISFQTKHLHDLLFYPDEKCQTSHLEACKQTIPEATFNENVSSEYWGVYDYSCIDISYIPRSMDLKKLDHFQGRIKYHEWDMECETRLRIAIRPKCQEYFIERDKFLYRRPSNEYLYAKLPDECLQSMTITLSPFDNGVLKDEVEKLLKDNDLYGKINVIESIFTGEL